MEEGFSLMSVRASALPALARRDLEACVDAPSVFTLFRKLRYHVEDMPVAVPLEEGDLPGGLRDGIAARYPVAQVGGVRPGDPLVSVTLFELNDQTRKSELIRGIAQAWTRRFLGEHLLIFAVKGQPDQGTFEQLAFVNTRRLGEEAQVRIKLHKLLLDRRSPTRHDLDTLNRIALPPGGLSAEQLYQAQCETFNVEHLTDTFYREYARRFRAAQQRIKQDNPIIVAFSDPTRLHTFTQRLFGRLMFLYFLQKKGALNGDHQFIKSWYEEAVRQEENFYRGILEPLFFDTLNRPRPEAQSRFGRIPYLNGGLFAPDDDDHVGAVLLADVLFDTRHPEGLLYFLENHNFTIEEDTPLEVEVALDPEMLGKVFENLLEEEERGQSGTFYTPRPVVAFMCREALAFYLTRETSIAGEPLGWLLDEAETGEPVRDAHGQPLLNTHSLPRTLRERVDRALEQVRVLDPAVGSGAFPLGMLALLVGVRRTLFRVGGVSVVQQTPLVEGWKRNFIRDCLYGVDIKREAIEIARLRFWLSLVVDADPFEMEPLPNLDFKLMAGDSLIETINGTAIYPTRPLDGETHQLALVESEAQRLIHQLRELKDEFFQPAGDRPAGAIKQEIVRTEREVVMEALREREQQGQELLTHLSKSLVSALPTQTNRAEIETLRHDIQTTQQAMADLEAGQTLPLFLYRLHFASVFEEKDGFDIVIANPPYVRHERIPQEALRTLRATYSAVQNGMADLYVYFYARALELLHESGTLGFISSNKFFRAGYGRGLRDLLNGQTQAQLVLDFGDAPVFDAAAYPCIVLVAKGRPTPDHTYRGLTADPQMNLEKIDTIFASSMQRLPQAQGVQPPASNRAVSALVEKLLGMGTPLGHYGDGKMYYGIKPGVTEAFIVNQATKEHLGAEDEHSAEVIKPVLRGRDLGRYMIHNPRLFLLYIDWHCDILQYPAIQAHLEHYHERLARRPECRQGRFQWFALSRYAADYSTEFERPKIISVRFGLQTGFVYDDQGFYCNDAVYFFSPAPKWLTAVLNSSICNFCLISICPSVQNGYSQFFVNKIKQLPIVEPALADQTRLAALVDRLQAVSGQGSEAEALEREVDTTVYRTYGLTEEEIAEIERWHAERRAQMGAGRRRLPIVEDEEIEEVEA
jgi:adenine-specific DNA-methyltransferase